MPQNRTKTGRFKPGNSGNPGGRPKRTPEQRDALEAVKSLAPDAVEAMERLLKAKDTPPALRVRIAEIVLDRAYGKPKQCTDVGLSHHGEDVTIVIGGEEM